MISEIKSLSEAREQSMNIIKSKELTYEQKTSQLAKLAENLNLYPSNSTNEKLFEISQNGGFCDLWEGHAPYAPRYICPDYQKLLDEGCAFLRLEKSETLLDAIHNLLIFYHHVPSVTRYPVYIGKIDKLLNPFITDVEEAKKLIKWFLISLDRTINDSFCHANIGPEKTLAGEIILELLPQLNNVTPNMTILYDEDITPDDFAEKCIYASLLTANPAFANDKYYRKDFNGDYAIASCYNGLPIRGGAFTLSRLRLGSLARTSNSKEDFFNRVFPEAIDLMCNFMEAKIKFLVEETPFFSDNFLVKEGFVELDRFVGLFGVVGLHECVEELLKLEKINKQYGKDDYANNLGLEIMEYLENRVNSFVSEYSTFWNNRFLLHSQVGAQDDNGDSAGVRIQIGKELPMYDHIRHSSLFHKFFPSGIGDHFPFDETAQRNPSAVLDIFKASFRMNMRYISCYGDNGDLIRVTGYLVKKSDMKKFIDGERVSYDTVQYAKDAFEKYHLLERKVRDVGKR